MAELPFRRHLLQSHCIIRPAYFYWKFDWQGRWPITTFSHPHDFHSQDKNVEFRNFWKIRGSVLYFYKSHLLENFFRRNSGLHSLVGDVGFVLERWAWGRKSSPSNWTSPLHQLSEGASPARLPALRDGQRGTGWEPAWFLPRKTFNMALEL